MVFPVFLFVFCCLPALSLSSVLFVAVTYHAVYFIDLVMPYVFHLFGVALTGQSFKSHPDVVGQPDHGHPGLSRPGD